MTESQIIDDLYNYYGYTRGGKKSKLMLDCAFGTFQLWKLLNCYG